MKCFIYGHYNLGDQAILEMLKQSVKEECIYLGERVDLSRITPSEQNTIIVVNQSLFKLDIDKVFAYINKDLTKPLIVVQKKKTFGAVFFNDYKKIERITTNKLFTFAGILYIPKDYFRKRMSEIFRNLNDKKENTRVYIIN